MSSGELSFACGVDELSETQVLDELNHLNYCIDNMIMNIMAADQSLRPQCTHQKPAESACDTVLLAFIRNSQLSDQNARNVVVENHLRNLIFSLLHIHFFDGNFFFGVGSETLRENLDRMIMLLIAGGKLCPF